MSLTNIGIRVSPLSNRIVLARFGKSPDVALESRDAMNEFLQALVQYAFDGKMPDEGEGITIDFEGGSEQFTAVIRRKSTAAAACHVNSGAYRQISVDEWKALGGDGNPLCDWHEGIGYVVYDEKALEQFRAKTAGGDA